MGSRQQTIEERLREAIRAAEKRGVTRYRIAKDAGLRQSHLHRIADGKAVPRLDVARKIAAALNLDLTLTPHKGTTTF